MNVHLMHPARDVDLTSELPPEAEDLAQDLDIEAIVDAMSQGDPHLRSMAERALLTGLTDVAAIRYRQDVLRDCLAQPEAIRRLYALATDVTVGHRRIHGLFFFARSPESVLARSLDLLEFFSERLRELRRLTSDFAPQVRSQGLGQLCATARTELDDAYFATVAAELRELRFANGIHLSAGLGPGCKPDAWVLHRWPAGRRGRWRPRILGTGRDVYAFEIPERDESGLQALADLRGRSVSSVANVLAQSADHILGFFACLRSELGFYVGCLNLHDALVRAGAAPVMPEPCAGGGRLCAKDLRDAALTLRTGGEVVPNDLAADGTELVMITGANQGGKSTFLRGVGLAFVMLRAGMFVAAASFAADVPQGVFTHFKRQEDANLESGKFEEELARLSAIVDRVRPGSVILCNESLAATSEREGSEIARQVVRGLGEAGVRVLFVTHLFDLADSLYRDGGRTGKALFLRADRGEDGRRTFRLREGAPQPTSHGEDLYRSIFGADA